MTPGGRCARGDTAAIQHEDLGALIDYGYWVRDRVLAAAALVPERAFQAADTVATRDLRATLVHQLENECAWRIRLIEGAFPDGALTPADYPTLGVLVDHWRREERALRTWFDGLSDTALTERPPGDDNVLPMWRYLVYVVTHGIQQFSEAAVMLTHLGHSPGEIGFLEFSSDPGKG